MKVLIRALLICGLFISGCSLDGGTKIEERDQSLGDIKKAIVAVIGDPRKVSENQREFTGQYVDRSAPSGRKERLYYQVTILGSRRPYDIEIHAFVESLIGKGYESSGEDTPAAKKVSKELQQRLNQGRDGRNLIDDFRAF